MRASQHREPPGPSNGRAVSSTATGLGRGRLEKGFGGWLREAREVRGWSAAHLARECGLTTLTVSRIEREVQTPRALSAMLLIRALGPSESELLELIRPHDDERAMLSRAFGKSVRRHRRSARLSPGQLAGQGPRLGTLFVLMRALSIVVKAFFPVESPQRSAAQVIWWLKATGR